MRGLSAFICVVTAWTAIGSVMAVAEPAAERSVSYSGYFPGSPTLDVVIKVTGQSGETADVVEIVPAGWTVKKKSSGSVEADGKLTWSSVSAKPTGTSVSYTIVPPAGVLPDVVFSGKVGNADIGGKTTCLMTLYETGQAIPFNTGLYYNYLVILPQSYNVSSKTWPLIMFLHSWSERGSGLTAVKNFALAKIAADPAKVKELLGNDEFPFIVVAPQAPPSDSVWREAHFLTLLERVKADFHVDQSRIYITGTSFGGGASWDFACTHPELFAAIAPISGGGSGAAKIQNMVGHCAAWAFHNRNDTVTSYTYNKKCADDLTALGGEAQFTLYPDSGHDAWTKAYNTPELYPWLLSHSKSSGTACLEWMIHE